MEKGRRKYRHELQKVNMEMEKTGEHNLKSYEARKIATNKERPLDSQECSLVCNPLVSFNITV